MTTLRFYIFGFVCCLFPLSNFAQKLNHFPESPDGFLQELEVFLTKNNNTLSVSFAEFSKALEADPLTERELKSIVLMCNLMRKEKMPAAPYFKAYLEAVVGVRSTGKKHFPEWQESLQKLIASMERKKDFTTYLNFSTRFFYENSLRFSRSGINWKSEDAQFSIQSKNGIPEIHFEKLALICTRKKDAIRLEKASGIYFPLAEKWKGTEAEISFERAGLKDVYTKIKDFEIDCSKGSYKAENAILIHPGQFGTQEIEGSFEDKLLVENKTIGTSYPRFESKLVNLNLNHLCENMLLRGGVQFHGEKMYVFGNEATPIVMQVFDNHLQTLKFRAAGQFFTINQNESLYGEMVATTLYFGQDSLYHPSADLRFNFEEKELHLAKGKRGSGQNPFFDSYHKILLHTDKLDWFLNNDSIVINQKNLYSGSSGQNVTFESLNFFDIQKYLRIQNVASKNPVAILKQISEEESTRTFKAIHFAETINPDFDLNAVRSLLANLAAMGFIDYHAGNETITVKNKAFLYADAAMDKTDYDVLHFESKSERTNAVLDLNNKEITTRDVKHITFSESQKVAGKPKEGTVIIRKNRNLNFDGKLYAGFSRLDGKNFDFRYDDFKVDMDSILFFDLFIPSEELDENNVPIAHSIASRIENLTGTLSIDDPENKSGREDIEKYPSFNSAKNAFVYYDYKGTQNGAYHRDSFFFELLPFTFDKLDNFKPDALNFSGKMFPAGIFPAFDETIVLQEDASLGFLHKCPKGGYPAYRDKGNFSGEVKLSNNGFIAKGNVQYMQASIDAESLIFMPAQMLTAAEQFHLEEDRGSEFPVPEVSGVDVKIDWQPYKDSMYIVSREKPFQLFKTGNHTLGHTLILTPKGLKGRGIYNWEKAQMESQLFAFDAHGVQTDTALLQIKVFNSNEMALETSNVFAELDFDKQIGFVKSNIDSLTSDFPYNKYESSMNEFEWDMTEEVLTFRAKENERGNFYATAKAQKGLWFQGTEGVYNLKTNLLNINGVEHIIASDAFILPGDGKVEIQPGGKMTRLENAKIVADTINRNHVINRAVVDILDKENYQASGFYEYNIAGKLQEIAFADIKGAAKKRKSNSVTTATGEITTEDFYIDNKTRFKGTINLKSDNKNLHFAGYGQLDAKYLPKQEWFTINSEGDKSDLKLSLHDVKSDHGVELKTGIYMGDFTVYPLVMMERRRKSDRCIFDASGLLDFDAKNELFILGDSLKIVGSINKGNQLVFDDKDGTVQMEGAFNLGSGLEHVSIFSAGNGTASFAEPDANEGIQPGFELELMAGLELQIPEKLLAVIVADLKNSGYDADPVDYNAAIHFYEKALAELVADEKALYKTCNTIRSSSKLKISEKKNKTDFWLSNLKMVWNTDLQSFVSKENKLALGNINGESVDRTLEGYLEVRMPGNADDRVYFYLKTPADFYYFFGYKQGILSIFSNNLQLEEAFTKLKKKELFQKMKNGEDFEIQYVGESTVNRFLSRVKS